MRKEFLIFALIIIPIFFLISMPYTLFARQGIIILNNGNQIQGNIIHTKNGDYTVETKKYSVLFLKKEIKTVKYTGKQKPGSVDSDFIRKMKNTKRMKKEKEKNYEYDLLIHIYADKYNLDPAFIKAVVEAESNFNPNDVSSKGAIGLMQLMPQTAKGMKVDPENIEENIEGGIRYLNYMFEKFNDLTLALAGYNAGPGAVTKYGKKVPPYKETQNYIKKVLRNYQKYKSDKQMWYFLDKNGCIHFSDTPKDKRYKRIEK